MRQLPVDNRPVRRKDKKTGSRTFSSTLAGRQSIKKVNSFWKAGKNGLLSAAGVIHYRCMYTSRWYRSAYNVDKYSFSFFVHQKKRGAQHTANYAHVLWEEATPVSWLKSWIILPVHVRHSYSSGYIPCRKPLW